jgi:hypothetical protein
MQQIPNIPIIALVPPLCLLHQFPCGFVFFTVSLASSFSPQFSQNAAELTFPFPQFGQILVRKSPQLIL